MTWCESALTKRPDIYNHDTQVKCAEIRCIIRTTPNATPAPHRLCLEVISLNSLLIIATIIVIIFFLIILKY